MRPKAERLTSVNLGPPKFMNIYRIASCNPSIADDLPENAEKLPNLAKGKGYIIRRYNIYISTIFLFYLSQLFFCHPPV